MFLFTVGCFITDLLLLHYQEKILQKQEIVQSLMCTIPLNVICFFLCKMDDHSFAHINEFVEQIKDVIVNIFYWSLTMGDNCMKVLMSCHSVVKTTHWNSKCVHLTDGYLWLMEVLLKIPHWLKSMDFIVRQWQSATSQTRVLIPFDRSFQMLRDTL